MQPERTLKIKIAFVVVVDTMFRELFRVAQALRSDERFESLFIFSARYPALSRDISLCEREKLPYVKFSLLYDIAWSDSPASEPNSQAIDADDADSEKIVNKSGWLASLPSRRIYTFLRLPLLPIRLAIRLYWRLLYLWKNQQLYFRDQKQRLTFTLSKTHELIDSHNPDIFILAEDSVDYQTAALCHEASKRGIATLVIPFTISSAAEIAEAFYANRSYWAYHPYNLLFALKHPEWVYEYKGRRLVRLPGPRAQTFHDLGIAPPAPWMHNYGLADAIAVESKRMFDNYRRQGLPPERLHITGSTPDDLIAAQMNRKSAARAELYSAAGFKDLKKPMIAIALPPYQFPRPECEFGSYEDLVRAWAADVGAYQDLYNIVVALHPRLIKDEMLYIEEYGMKIVELDTACLVPLADVYIASISATIRWAIAAGVPVVNYDVYRYDYADFSDVRGVLYCRSRTDFQRILASILKDEDALASVRREQEKVASEWGALDGHATDRLAKLIRELCQVAADRVGRSKRFLVDELGE